MPIEKEPSMRPCFHFTPPQGWMNDPNGLVLHDGVYHLYYQYDPDNTLPVSMHWGHATSTDLLHWKHQPTALYPDEHGAIYSGCVVADKENTSGFAEETHSPLVACFTYHKEESGSYSQSQGIAHSLDGGYLYHKYSYNPVLTWHQPDFRDPMVFWHENTKSWVMLLVAGRSVRFYKSPNLIQWEFSGTFVTQDPAEHPGELWECPCLVQLPDETGKKSWVLFVSVIAPEGNCFGMRYFVGDFDGGQFVSSDTLSPHWLDSGPDFYAGAVFSGQDDPVVMMAWMNCWYYARRTPDHCGWRGSMAFPRALFLRHNPVGAMVVCQRFFQESGTSPWKHQKSLHHLSSALLPISGGQIHISFVRQNTTITLHGEENFLAMHYDSAANTLTIHRNHCDRTQQTSPFFCHPILVKFSSQDGPVEIELLLDKDSIELLSDNGETACSFLCFPDQMFRILESDQPLIQMNLYSFEEHGDIVLQ